MTDTYNRLADLLEYPASNWESKIAACADNDALTKFRSGIAALSLSDLQELYTRTFDLNPVCALEVGYHLFGENYKRGEFLAHLRETEAPFDLGQENQLPDYLPVLLRLLTKLDDEELRSSLISQCMVPAIEKMLTSFKGTENPYQFLLEVVCSTLQTEVPVVSIDAPLFHQRPNLPVLPNAPGACIDPHESPAMREFGLLFGNGWRGV
jgi:nitrate reductase delta subunit